MRARRALLWALGAALVAAATMTLAELGRRPRLRKLARIDLQAARSLYDLDRLAAEFRFDEEAVLLCVPNRDERWKWPEHPDGFFRLRTNALGFVESGPTSQAKAGQRILVVGDSHTQGLANPEETFPNVLEELLASEGREAPVEVINAGVGYTGPYCYGERLKKYLYLEPDVFVATLFTGNDFWDDLLVHYTLEGIARPTPGPEYLGHVQDLREQEPGMLFQGLNQAYRFKHFPAEAELAFERVLRSFEGMRATCEAEGIEFLVVVLPTKIDVDRDRPEELARALDRLELTPVEAGVNRRLGERFAREMERRGILCVDLAPHMEAGAGPYFWHEDDHLALAGHRLVAERVLGELDGRL